MASVLSPTPQRTQRMGEPKWPQNQGMFGCWGASVHASQAKLVFGTEGGHTHTGTHSRDGTEQWTMMGRQMMKIFWWIFTENLLEKEIMAQQINIECLIEIDCLIVETESWAVRILRQALWIILRVTTHGGATPWSWKPCKSQHSWGTERGASPPRGRPASHTPPGPRPWPGPGGQRPPPPGKQDSNDQLLAWKDWGNYQKMWHEKTSNGAFKLTDSLSRVGSSLKPF